MKKKLLLILSMVALLCCIFALTVSAEVTTYDDAPAKEKLTVSTNDVVVFDDGFTCPSAYIFKDTDTVSNGDHTGKNGVKNNLDFSYINGKTENSYDVTRIRELDIPEGMVTLGGYGFTRLEIKRISIPKTVTSIGGCCFEKCTALEQCVFEHTEDSDLTSLPAWIFQGCTSLTAFCFPECIEEINSEYEFSGCTSLTAVYLPKNLTAYKTSGNDQKSVFWGCENMYFVNERFTYDNIPQKPAIYYFPSNLATMTGELFKKCENLNETLVFPAGVTSVPNGWAFSTDASTVENVVFLGDMTTLNTSSWKLADGGKIIFANANDVDSSSLSTLSGGHTKIYCASETDLSKHVVKRTETTAATCDTNKYTKSYCFCGKLISEGEEEGTMLGHSHTIFVDLVYESYSEAGYYSYKCERCDDVNNDEAAPALFICLGYSAQSYGNGGILVGFGVNNKAISEYADITGDEFKFGMFAGRDTKLGENDAVNANGEALTGIASVDYTERDFDIVEFKVVGFVTDEHKDANLALGIYVIDGEAVSYVQASKPNEGEKYSYVSYNSLIG